MAGGDSKAKEAVRGRKDGSVCSKKANRLREESVGQRAVVQVRELSVERPNEEVRKCGSAGVRRDIRLRS